MDDTSEKVEDSEEEIFSTIDVLELLQQKDIQKILWPENINF